jgi:exonuclease III
MKILSWNCQGLGNPRTVRALKKLLASHSPDLLFIMETKLVNSKFQFITNNFESYSVKSVNCTTSGGGKAGGIALIWNHCTIMVDIINFDFNYFDVLISTDSNPNKWRATGLYGYPQQQNKLLTCRLISDLSEVNNHPQWLVFGDFNILLSDEEKLGGNLIDPNTTNSFRNILSICDLQDLGYTGNKYTWTNKHQGDSLIFARLDRFIATTEWKNRFPYHINHHLLRYKSDHNPIMLDFSSNVQNKVDSRPRLKRFEQVWTREENHMHKVKAAWDTSHGNIADRLHTTLETLHNWGHQIFGTLPKKIKQVQDELMYLNQTQGNPNSAQAIKDKESELDKLLDGEEMWWKQRSRADWLQHGDKNTKFFHLKASQRKKRNTIKSIMDKQGQSQTKHEDIESVLLDHFETLFKSQPTHQIQNTVEVVKNKLSNEMRNFLKAEFQDYEVYNAVKDMKSMAAPGPDGLPALFYHTYWDIVGNDVTREILDILNNNKSPDHINQTYICLIPKIPSPSQASDLRPTSLCNVTLKIVTKTVANRLKTILPDIISPN